MGHGWNVCRRRVARRTAARRRGIHAHGILRRHASRGGSQLCDRQLFWNICLALDVCRRWTARAVAGLGAPRGDGAGALEEKSTGAQFAARLAAFFSTFFKCVAAQNDFELAVHAGIHLWIVGGNRVRARGSDNTGRRSRKDWPASGATCFARGDAGFLRNDSGLPGDALARRKAWAARGAELLFRPDARFHCADVWKSFLSWRGSLAVVLRLPFLPGIWRGQFCGVHPLAAGAVSYGVPR